MFGKGVIIVDFFSCPKHTLTPLYGGQQNFLLSPLEHATRESVHACSSMAPPFQTTSHLKLARHQERHSFRGGNTDRKETIHVRDVRQETNSRVTLGAR